MKTSDKVGQVRAYHHMFMGDIVYLVLREQAQPWIEIRDYPWQWLLFILDVSGVHLSHVAPAGSLTGADESWLQDNTKVIA